MTPVPAELSDHNRDTCGCAALVLLILLLRLLSRVNDSATADGDCSGSCESVTEKELCALLGMCNAAGGAAVVAMQQHCQSAV